MNFDRPKVRPLRCSLWEFFKCHDRECKEALARRNSLEYVVAQLFNRATDERGLYQVWFDLEQCEKQAPGSTALSAVGFRDGPEVNAAISGLRWLLRSRDFSTGQELLVYVPHRDYPTTVFTLPTGLADQIARSATWRILEPLLVPGLERRWLKTRSFADRRRALNRAIHLSETRRRFVWVRINVKRTSDRVSRDRLLDLLWDRVPNQKLLWHIETLIKTPTGDGILDVGPLTELLVDFYWNQLIAYEWRKLFRHPPLVHGGEHYLMLCETEDEAERAYAELKQIIRRLKLQLCKPRGNPIRDLTRGESAIWLDFVVSWSDGHWMLDLDDDD